jgi:hypothetical protein
MSGQLVVHHHESCPLCGAATVPVQGGGRRCPVPPCEWSESTSEAKSDPATLDENLWRECQELSPTRIPGGQLPILLGHLGRVAVWLVDGDDVKVRYRMDFFDGGHDLVYHWIPKRQIWIDGTDQSHEWPFNLYHEAHERRLMEGGASYDRAHADATRIEHELRLKAGQASRTPTRVLTTREANHG